MQNLCVVLCLSQIDERTVPFQTFEKKFCYTAEENVYFNTGQTSYNFCLSKILHNPPPYF